ncbi:MAG: hypothetical protein ABSF67_22600 [Roseiarcus sp.]|jgi:hypothetical protein
MTSEFSAILRDFASRGGLDDADVRRLPAVASFDAVDAGLAESIGAVGGNELAVARVVAERVAERRRIESRVRDVIKGEWRPYDVQSFCWTVSQLRGRPPQDIAGALGVMAAWNLVADALERRLSPRKPATTGGQLHDVA